ncbi:MAG: toll/interleukin-1 receptor domain-containing protein, partial [Verrucomicrobia bacterium]|nr:toll/interleukin-1 receptor domain-containing protein [Verrucomicrobiota bacterium]
MLTKEIRFFVSYARADEEFVLKLDQDLRAAGVNLWLDQLDIDPGKHWDRAIEEALKTCQGMLVVLSPASVESKNVLDEMSYALGEEKKIIPVLYLKCDIPWRLGRLQFVDFTGSYDTGFTQLLRFIRKAVLAHFYQELCASGREALQNRTVEIAPFLDALAEDKRRGLTLIVRPSPEVAARFSAVIDRLKEAAPNHFYYDATRFHFTIL